MLSVIPSDSIPSDLLTPRRLYEASASATSWREEITIIRKALKAYIKPDERVRRYLIDSSHRSYSSSRNGLHSPLKLQREIYKNDRSKELTRNASPRKETISNHLLGLMELPGDLEDSLRRSSLPERASRWFIQIASVCDLSWLSRIQAIEWSLAQISSEYFDKKPHRNRKKSFATILEYIAMVPSQIGDASIKSSIRSRWHETFPVLVAFAERSPEEVAGYLSRSPFKWRNLLRELPRQATRRYNSFVADRWAGYLVEEPQTSRAHLPPRQMEVIHICMSDLETRERKALSLMLQENPEPVLLRSLAILLAQQRPRLVELIVGRIEDEELRNELCLTLIRDNWIPRDSAARIYDHISSGALALEAMMWLNLRSPKKENEWLKSLSSLIGLYGVDPSDPSFRSVLESIWQDSPTDDRGALTEAVLVALDSGDSDRSEAGILLWIHSFLAKSSQTPLEPTLKELIDCLEGSLTL
jgi:hypothetical protein